MNDFKGGTYHVLPGHGIKIQVITNEKGEPWFVANEVCEVLGIGNPRQSLSYLDDDEKGVTINDTPGGPQRMTIINEPGLYSLVLRSRKPVAKSFKRWVTHEVLPQWWLHSPDDQRRDSTEY